jgi:hypothetical protein
MPAELIASYRETEESGEYIRIEELASDRIEFPHRDDRTLYIRVRLCMQTLGSHSHRCQIQNLQTHNFLTNGIFIRELIGSNHETDAPLYL